MKEDFDTDELLNCFIDGELTARQQTEVQRIIDHDYEIAGRLERLRRCRMLVKSLPRAEAPEGMLEDIKASLERRTLLGEAAGSFDERAGAMHLFGRKVLTAAAMIGLVAVLTAVVYTIVAPETARKGPVAVEPVSGHAAVKYETAGKGSEPQTAVSAGKSGAAAAETGPVFVGRLELTTSRPHRVVGLVNKAIEAGGFLNQAYQTTATAPSIVCGRDDLAVFFEELRGIWDAVDSARLFVETGRAAEPVVVNDISLEQVMKVIGQDSFEESIRLAGDFASLNSMADLVPGKELLAAVEPKAAGLMTAPKPTLTSSAGLPGEPAHRAGAEENVYLSIVIADRQ